MMGDVSLMSLFLMCTCGVLIVVCPARAVTRRYYVAAVEEEWDYAPGGGDRMAQDNSFYVHQQSDYRVYLESGPQRIGSKYLKAMYREYTDSTFTTRTPRDPWLGFLGPIIKAELDDVIEVTFKNMASRNYSMHPHGVTYTKDNEGAYYSDGTSGADKADDGVPPGHTFVYTWHVRSQGAPSHDDDDCLTWVYHSHVQTVHDTNSGLIGILLTCKPGALARVAARYKQFALLFNVMDENLSWYLDDNIRTYCTDPSSVDKEDEGFKESNLMHGINARVYGHLEGLTACVGTNVMWHLVGFGTEVDIHSVTISGHSFLTSQHRKAAVMLNPVDFVTATMTVNVAGNWRVMCNILDHVSAGMEAIFNASHCRGEKDSSLEYKIQRYRNYYLAIDEVNWNYAPGGQNKFDGGFLTRAGSPSEVYFRKDAGHVGGVYTKAVFHQYDDISFSRLTLRSPDHAHLGLLGPVLRAEVGDVVSVTLKNNARFPFSITTNGAAYIKLWEGALYNDSSSSANKRDDAVSTGQVRTYYWFVPENMGPGPLDPPCIMRMYTSSSRDIVRDTYSGLVGPFLVCRRGALDNNNKQRQVDREFFLLFSVTDENKSWYKEHNFRKLTGVDFNDEEFHKSNLMHGINGYLYGTLPGLEMCEGDRVVWYVFSVGSEMDLHTVYLHGQSLTILDTHRSATEVLPGSFKTLYMQAKNLGEWALVCRTNEHYRAGTTALFNVRDCGLQRDYNIAPRKEGQNRTYFLQAEEEIWDYAPSGKDMVFGGNLSNPNREGYIFTRSDPPYLGTRYLKARYHQYTDDTFSTRVPRSPEHQHLGILGPVISAAAFDTVTVVFRNNASRPYSIHAQGLFYAKSSEGASYGGQDGSVPPGGVAIYTWTVPEDYAPAQGDPPCITQAYYSAVDPIKDPSSGLIGPILVCKQGVLDKVGHRTDVDRSFTLLFQVIDENESWYAEQLTAGDNQGVNEADFTESNLMHSINGYLYGNNPPIVMPQNSLVDWHLMTLGSVVDIHSVHFHGNDVRVFQTGVHHRDVTQLMPGVMRTVVMNATEAGQWLLHCHVHDHITAGMETTYTVEEPVMSTTTTTTPNPFGLVPPS